MRCGVFDALHIYSCTQSVLPCIATSNTRGVAAGVHSKVRCERPAVKLLLCPCKAPGSVGCGFEDTDLPLLSMQVRIRS